MSSTLGDPVLLTTFGLPSSTRKGKGKEVAVDERPFVFASFSSIPHRDEEQVTLAVQGDGIHVYELGDLHPVASRTLGPSTSFASVPAAVVSSDGESSIRHTYVAVQYAQDVKKEDAARVIWAWKESVSDDISSSQERQSAKLSHDVAYLLSPRDSDFIIAVSSTGSLTRMDLDLNAKNTWSPKVVTQSVTKAFVFPVRDCRFLQAGGVLNGYALIMFIERNEKLVLQMILFGTEAEMTILEPLDVPLGEIDYVVDISLDPSGNMSVLGSNGTWNPYSLSLKNGSTRLSPESSPLHLRDLSFISEKERNTARVSLLSLGSSFVLLAGTTAKEIALLLWDIQYGVLLHSTTLPIPSTLDISANGSGASVQLAKGSGSQALLILSPRRVGSKRNGQLRSSVLVVPFSVPERSTIASVMGKAAQGAPWLAGNPSESRQEDEDVLGREVMLASLQEAIAKGRLKQAEDVFFDWIKENDVGAKATSRAPPAAGDVNNEQEDVEMAEEELQKANDTKKLPPLKSLLDHAFVTRILSSVLPADDARSKQYLSKICRYLVSKRLVSHGMVKSGLLDALLQRNDWVTIRQCFPYVEDLPENELLRLLHIVVQHHREQSQTDKDSMAVDEKPSKKRHRKDEIWDSIPTVNSFLACVVDYPASQAAWRMALREHFADVDDLMAILIIANDWIDAYSKKGLRLGLGEVAVNEHGVPVPDEAKSIEPIRMKGYSLPSLEKLLVFLQTILDASFLSLLQNPASHPVLQRISENVAQIQAVNLELQSLRGPLEPFVRMQAKTVAEAAGGGKKREEVDWRKRRKQAHEQAALSLGPYQVEELVF